MILVVVGVVFVLFVPSSTYLTYYLLPPTYYLRFVTGADRYVDDPWIDETSHLVPWQLRQNVVVQGWWIYKSFQPRFSAADHNKQQKQQQQP